MSNNLIDETAVHKFLQLLHAHAAAALGEAASRGVLHLCALAPDEQAMATRAFSVGDVARMAEAAVLAAKSGKNVFTEARVVKPGTPSERGRLDATEGVFAFVIDRDADNGKAGCALNGEASIVVETSPDNTHEWLFVGPALNADAAKKLGVAIRKATGADACTGVVTQPYRIPGTPNYPDTKKRERGRVVSPTRLIHANGKVWSADDLQAAFPKAAATKQQGTEQCAETADTKTARKVPKSVLRKIARKPAVGKRSESFHAAVAAAVQAGLTAGEIEARMREHPDGVARKYLEGEDRLRREIDRSFEKVQPPKRESNTACRGRSAS
jgi:hypothetical protein